jgi:hypothetical protein
MYDWLKWSRDPWADVPGSYATGKRLADLILGQ